MQARVSNKRVLPTPLSLVIALGVLAASTSAHILGIGSCRDFPSMSNFDPVRFNGTWYVIKKVATASSCLTVNYNLKENGEDFKVEEVRRPPYSTIVPIDLSVTNTGVLNTMNSPSKFEVTWYNGIIPMSGTYLIGDTDYDNYAIDYECQGFAGIFRRVSATILSRTPQMDQATIDELVERVSSTYDISGTRMRTVDQDDCIALDGNDFNFVIDENGIKSALKEYEELKTLAQNSPEEIVKLVEADNQK